MQKRKIKSIIPAQDVQMGPMTLKQPLPMQQIQQVDPFLLIHHAGPIIQEPFSPKNMDVGPHPHRGFEPVTFIFKGEIHHRDSRGNDSIIRSGGVQWMTAGMGIVHSESTSKSFFESGGEIEIIQLWINLPSRLKMVQPRYQGAQQEDIPVQKYQEGNAQINVVSGSYQDLKGPIDSLTGITAYTLELKAGSTLDLPSDPAQNVILYQLNGTSKVNDYPAYKTELVIFEQEGEHIHIEAEEDCALLFLSGFPIGEKVEQYGPFVMNNQTQIMEAMRDYQMGKMGILINE